MATPIGRTSGLDQRLFKHPERFDFFQATRLLEQLFVREQLATLSTAVEQSSVEAAARSSQNRFPLGYDAVPDEEVVRFRTTLSAAFPGTEVLSLTQRSDEPGLPPEMVVSFMGLVGPSGVMPDLYTERLREQALTGELAVHEFFDLFLHRVLSLFYRGWKKNRSSIGYEQRLSAQLLRTAQSTWEQHWDIERASQRTDFDALRAMDAKLGELREQKPTEEILHALTVSDAFSNCLRCLTGLGQPGVRANLAAHFLRSEKKGTASPKLNAFGVRLNPQSVEDAVIYYAGHFASPNRSAKGLEDVLGDVFAEPVSVEPFQPSWLFLDAEVQSRLPTRASTPDSSLTHLGDDFVLGTRVRDQETRFVIRIGPISSWQRFRALLPWSLCEQDALQPSGANRLLQQLTRLYAGPQYAIDVNLLLAESDLPQFCLRIPSRKKTSGNDQPADDARAAFPLLGWTTVLGRSGNREHAARAAKQEEGVFADVMFSLDFIPSPN